jgi:hypothetical protein
VLKYELKGYGPNFDLFNYIEYQDFTQFSLISYAFQCKTEHCVWVQELLPIKHYSCDQVSKNETGVECGIEVHTGIWWGKKRAVLQHPCYKNDVPIQDMLPRHFNEVFYE